jgi:hypothetical protein
VAKTTDGAAALCGQYHVATDWLSAKDDRWRASLHGGWNHVVKKWPKLNSIKRRWLEMRTEEDGEEMKWEEEKNEGRGTLHEDTLALKRKKKICHYQSLKFILENIFPFKLISPSLHENNIIIPRTGKTYRMNQKSPFDECHGGKIRCLNRTFSIQGLFFLSGAWMRGSPFSFSSMYDFILQGKIKSCQNIPQTCKSHCCQQAQNLDALFQRAYRKSGRPDKSVAQFEQHAAYSHKEGKVSGQFSR